MKRKRNNGSADEKPVKLLCIGREWHVVVNRNTVKKLGIGTITNLFNYHVGSNGSKPAFMRGSYRFHVGQDKSAIEPGVNRMRSQVISLVANKRKGRK